MKKKLEAELISIAHRILKLKNKSDLVQLHLETQKLYEKLSVLRFVEENFADVKPTIGYTEIENRLAVAFDAELPSQESLKTESTPAETAPSELPKADQAQEMDEPQMIAKETKKAPVASPANDKPSGASSVSEQIEKSGKAIADLIKGIRGSVPPKAPESEGQTEAEPVAELEIREETVAPAEVQATAQAEEEVTSETASETTDEEEPKNEEDLFKPAFEWSFEEKREAANQGLNAVEASKDAESPKMTPAQISFDDLLGQSYKDPIFVKPEDLQSEKETLKPAEKSEVIPISRNFNDTSNVISINKSETLNDRVSKGITIGLNDRIAFMNHLFNNSSEDYNRVLSQLITFDSLDNAKNFIDTMVKPDYNNWTGKEEYEQRFMEIIEKKFS